MTIDEMNKYILHYLKADKTHSAIMLTGAWGSGKSYYIQNNLCPFLAQKENGEIQSIIVSLYGMTRLSDISKSLYMETRLKCLNANTESAALARIAARTIIKGITNHVGIDVIATDADLSRLYESADLSNKLIILEDIERTQINTIEVLGYVNSLVEQDGVKVLLVANEDELIKFEPIIGETPPKYDWNKTNAFDVKRNKNYTNTTKLYLSVKEKTICDTINFVGDIKSAIKQIIKTFDSTLKQFADDDVVEEIYSILSKDSSFNLRSLIFACQKSSDIFQMTGLIADAGDDFSKTLFEGVLCFSLKFKQGINMPWTGSRLLSFDLGNSRYPLFRFCYDYICMQQLNTDLLLETKEELEKLRQYDRYKSINDSDLQMLYNYQIQPESAICQAVENITKKLKNQYNIAFHEYGKLAVYLIRIHNLIQCDISSAKELLVSNLRNRASEIQEEYLFIGQLDPQKESEAVIREVNEIREQMRESLNAVGNHSFDFDYKPQSINTLYKQVVNNECFILQNGSFAKYMDIDRVSCMLEQCTAMEINTFRLVFQTVYSVSNITDFFAEDRPYIEQLRTKVSSLKGFEKYDKIQKLQISSFDEDLGEILDRLPDFNQ